MESMAFPYSVSNFRKLVTENRYYVDRTAYIEKMERLDTPYNFFLRPRRFGKSLTVSVLEHYYDKQHKGDFELLFGKYYIGKNPTPLANSYLVLKFDFSGVETASLDRAMDSFLLKVKSGVLTMMGRYSTIFTPTDMETIREQVNPAEVVIKLQEIMLGKVPVEKLYVLIDEYDHFTNEIIAFHFSEFAKIVSRNGTVRKFFEAIKECTGSGVVDRMFVTGVSPITLDSLTSGFNIGTSLSLKASMHDFMGFTEEETLHLLHMAGVPEADMEGTMADVRSWYNGYLFTDEADQRLYNPDMVLYFATNYRERRAYPKNLLDTNMASDYGKMRRMLDVGSREANYAILEEIILQREVAANVTIMFSFERPWSRDDFISLLFYMGLLTVKGAAYGRMIFQIPNHVIEGLYYNFFQHLLLQRAKLLPDDLRIGDRVVALAADGDVEPLRDALEKVLKNLDNRDARHFNEKHVKMALMSLLVPTGTYSVFSEYPIGQGYADIVLLRRPPINDPKRQYVFELKHLKKNDADQLEEVSEEGREQLRRYLSHPLLKKGRGLYGLPVGSGRVRGEGVGGSAVGRDISAVLCFAPTCLT